MSCFTQSLAETRHKQPLAFTMHQGPVPTQLCCGTSKLGGARLTRMKESHEVHEIRQGTSDQRPLSWRYYRRFVLPPKLCSRVCRLTAIRSVIPSASSNCLHSPNFPPESAGKGSSSSARLWNVTTPPRR